MVTRSLYSRGRRLRDDLYDYLLPRSGKTAMVIGNMIGIIWVSLAYVAFLFSDDGTAPDFST
jgi:hypothetical protein